MTSETREDVSRRLNRIAGQVEGLKGMVEDDRYCVDVMHQIAAVRAALDRVGKVLLGAHVETCVVEAFASGSSKEREKKKAELLDVFGRFVGVGGR
jgi:DNA-binding FrmR family transcriptional regulator